MKGTYFNVQEIMKSYLNSDSAISKNIFQVFPTYFEMDDE